MPLLELSGMIIQHMFLEEKPFLEDLLIMMTLHLTYRHYPHMILSGLCVIYIFLTLGTGTTPPMVLIFGRYQQITIP